MDLAENRMQWAVGPLLWSLVIMALITGGCAVGPDYKGVQPEVGQEWAAELEEGLKASRPERETLARWWQVLADPVLIALEERAVAGNLGLKTALSRLRQARLERGISQSGFYPQFGIQGQAQKQRGSEMMPSSYQGRVIDYYISELDSSWELDLFGGLRRSAQAAKAEIEASQADLKDVLTSLMAEVAVDYIQVRSYQHRVEVARENVQVQEKTYEMNRSRHQAGLIDELAVQQSLRNLEQTRARLAQLESGLRASKNSLALLLGQRPGSLGQLLTPVEAIPEVPSQVAVGIPAEAMRRRPDIRQAERELAAQTARIGEAEARLYPKFHLFGTLGLEVLDAEHEFFDAKSRFWTLGPGLTWNIFQGGKLHLDIKLQTERQRQALIEYKAAVLRAQKEVEDALTAYAKEQVRQQALARAVQAARHTERLARDRYNSGLVDFYNVLEAQASLLELKDQLVQSKGQVVSNLAGLYKALGGGWGYYQQFLEQDHALADDELEQVAD